MAERLFDVVIGGGGLAGSMLGGVLARSGLGVLIVEKERAFRDRVRGELTFPWGYSEALRAGLAQPLDAVGIVPLPVMELFLDRQRIDAVEWDAVAIDGLPAIGFSHPRLQEAALEWAMAQGATVMRPAKVVHAEPGDRPRVFIDLGGTSIEVVTRLAVGADGKRSGARRWIDAETETDPEHHLFGGMLVDGVRWEGTFGWATTPAAAVGWFATGPDSCRLYVRLTSERVHQTGVARSPDAFVSFASTYMPDGTLRTARPAGPVGFFRNSCTWSTRVAAPGVVLVGDAAGALDPSQGLGTSLMFRDVRELSELLTSNTSWQTAVTEFAQRRMSYYDVLRAYDRWNTILEAAEGAEADRRRERNAAARAADPTLGGFGTLEARGPDGLVADDAARRAFFGE